MTDIGEVTRAVGLVDASQAENLLGMGDDAIQTAITLGNRDSLPGFTARENVQKHLTALRARQPYDMTEIRATVIQAFIEVNAVLEGIDTEEANTYFRAVREQLAEYGSAIKEAAHDIIGGSLILAVIVIAILVFR